MQNMGAWLAREKAQRLGLRSVMASMTLHTVFTIYFENDPKSKPFQMQDIVSSGDRIGFHQAILPTLYHIGTFVFTPISLLRQYPALLSDC